MNHRFTLVTQPNTAMLAMRKMVLKMFANFEWRHHGIGVLQAYIAEDTDPEIRIHIWSRDLLKPGMDLSGDIHDHRFDMVSHVLYGTVGHEEIRPIADSSGTWAMMNLTHARAAKENAYHGPTEELEGRYHVTRAMFEIAQGNTYKFPKQTFHRSPLYSDRDIAITCVEKHRQIDAPARILYPVSRGAPVMAFGHEMDWKVIGPVLARAMEVLSQ